MRATVRCPRCRKTAVELIEVWSIAAIYFRTDKSGLWDGQDGVVEPPDTVLRVEGLCICGHNWRLRGVTQISDIQGAGGKIDNIHGKG